MPAIASYWCLNFSLNLTRFVQNCLLRCLLISRTHIAYGLLLTTYAASDLFKMLRALLELTGRVVEILVVLMGVLGGSILSRSLCIVATKLSSPLL